MFHYKFLFEIRRQLSYWATKQKFCPIYCHLFFLNSHPVMSPLLFNCLILFNSYFRTLRRCNKPIMQLKFQGMCFVIAPVSLSGLNPCEFRMIIANSIYEFGDFVNLAYLSQCKQYLCLLHFGKYC